MIRSATYLFILALAVVVSSCTGLKNITSNDRLYVDSKVSFTEKSIQNKKLGLLLKDVLKPLPNNRFLWMRPALARNNMLSDSAKTKKFWKNKVTGPVLLSQTNPYQVSASIQNVMFQNGYFRNTVAFDTLFIRQRKAKFKYTITLNEPYKIESVTFPKPQNELTQKISDSQKESLLKNGEIYSLETAKNERVRIDRELKENGYIYFNPDFILLRADSTTGDHQLKIDVTVKPATPPESKKPYMIRKIFIYDDNMLDTNSIDTIQFEDYYLISQYKELDFGALKQGIFLKPGDLYTRSNYMHTIRYFNGLPIIRNANMKFISIDTTNKLDAILYLSQKNRFAYSAEFNTVYRSTNYFGPGVVFSYTDRNANKGAEMLKVNLLGSIEIQIVDGKVNPAYGLGVDASYVLPKFYPTFLFKSANKNLPKTSIAAGYNLVNRLDLYRLNSAFTNFGYRWSKKESTTHVLNPLEIIYTLLPEDSKSEEFINYLEENPGVQRSFDEQFILGSTYDFTYDPTKIGHKEIYFKGGIDVAGNLLNALYSATNAAKDTSGNYDLAGVPFSQYVRVHLELSNNFKLKHRSRLATRIVAGVGIPLGNSDVLPYIKQFYVGGTNSLRSFVARSVGPGSEVPPQGYNDLTGDIRLEGNVEFRFNIAGSLNGALFLDAGNVWLYNEDPSRPNGNFRFNTFIDQIAVSSGWGLRWDFDFIVARLDFAYTLRTPYFPEDERWASDINFWNPAINIAIGYPF